MGKILAAVIIVTGHHGAKVIPLDARAHAEIDVLTITVNLFDELNAGMQNSAIKIPGEQQVASAPDVQNALLLFP